MTDRSLLVSPAASWHLLLAPLPADATPSRQPVGSPEILARPEGAAIAGWEQLTIDLSAGVAGLRNVLVVLDASGQLVSANDSVLYRIEIAENSTGPNATPLSEYHQESIGGRFEADGGFRGTRWISVTVELAEEEEPQISSTPSEPSAADVASLRALVAEVIRRGAQPG